jgi:hypothetical protein
VKLAAVSVDEFMSSLKVAVILPLTATLVAVEVTLGAVLSGVAPVVKHQAKSFTSALPAGSLTPVMIVAVYIVLDASGVSGVNVAT